MEPTRLSLLARLKDPRDNEAWTEFRRVYGDLIRGYAARRLALAGRRPSDQQLDELAHDVFVKLWFKLPEFELDHDIGRFRTWLYRVVANHVLDSEPGLRAKPRDLDESEVALEGVADPRAAEPDAEWLQSFNLALLQEVVAGVRDEIVAANPAKWRCFEEQWLEAQPASEVAGRLGISAASVYQNSTRVLRRVRERFRELYGEEVA